VTIEAYIITREYHFYFTKGIQAKYKDYIIAIPFAQWNRRVLRLHIPETQSCILPQITDDFKTTHPRNPGELQVHLWPAYASLHLRPCAALTQGIAYPTGQKHCHRLKFLVDKKFLWC
jgi:hypothetical protein